MSSFFPPGFGTAAAAECGPEQRRYLIFCSSALSPRELFAHWYQSVNLAIGASAIIVPLLIFLAYQWLFRPKENAGGLGPRPKAKSEAPTSRRSRSKGLDGAASDKTLVGDRSNVSLRQTRSFRVVSNLFETDSEADDSAAANADLVVFPLQMTASRDVDSLSVMNVPRTGSRTSLALPRNDSRVSLALSVASSTTKGAQMRLGGIDIDSIAPEDVAPDTVSLTIAGLVERYLELDLTGFALRCSPTTNEVTADLLLSAFDSRGISCILLIHHDANILDTINLASASGLIIENACILPNGHRRGYFQSTRLRRAMTRCARNRDHRPEFFVGYLDQWLHRPHPSVVKRAVAIAEHFGAVFEHGPYDGMPGMGKARKHAAAGGARTIGGFEYLRRAEIIDLQRSWMDVGRGVSFGGGKDAALNLDDIEAVVPGASACLAANPLPELLARGQTTVSPVVDPPSYLPLFPASWTDFWNADQDGNTLSPYGCFPVGCEPLVAHYDAIVESQAHLLQLSMLEPVTGVEEQNVLIALRQLVEDGCDVRVHDLIAGLESRHILAFKGLHTGFRTPDGNAEFWGVYRVRHASDPDGVDIFISRQSPNDAAVILHTWLAHSGIPRVERFEHEVVLEGVAGQGQPHRSGLPPTIRVALEDASPSELLLLLQKLALSRNKHFLAQSIRAHVHRLLTHDTTHHNWTHLAARKALDRSLSVGHLLALRLQHLASQGATELPTLDNLLYLHDLVEDVVLDALFYGDHKAMSRLTKALLACYGREATTTPVDVSADLFAVVFFTVLRRAAFEDVYLETTDRCPLFLSQPDQAAVFSELWTLGSQCENYFGLVPRDIGDIIYHRYNKELDDLGAPTAAERVANEIMTVYASTDATPDEHGDAIMLAMAASSSVKLTWREWMQVWRIRFASASAMSIFCVPAVLDVLLLTFTGRGLFMTAFMEPQHVQVATYALLVSLLLTAGVTGWVGSAASHYLPHYAYDNMIYFHVQRLSGGFVIAVVISIGGIVAFGTTVSPAAGFVFAAYLIGVSTYLNVLGVMSTMHQHGSPLPSGRNVFLSSFLLILINPLVSSFVNGHDLEIYMSMTYLFLAVVLYRYRRLCHAWSTWLDNIPSFKAADIAEWNTTRQSEKSNLGSEADEQRGLLGKGNDAPDAPTAFRAALATHMRLRTYRNSPADPLLDKAARGMPYIDWLFKQGGGKDMPDAFTTAWFTKLGESVSQQRSLSRGLKDHNVLTLFRLARWDIGQNLGLFLVALLDRWIMLAMGARKPYPSIYTDERARYGFCFCIIYFCLGSLILDTTLFKYWSIRDALSEDKLANLDHAKQVAAEAERKRKAANIKALVDVFAKCGIIFGGMTLLMWAFIQSYPTTIMYYSYSFGYTCCLIFQFNRCFTTNTPVHVKIILYSASVGFVLGCVLHALPWTAGFLYNDLIAQNLAAGAAAIGTTLFTYKDWSSKVSPLAAAAASATPADDDPTVYVQPKLMSGHAIEATLRRRDLPKTFLVPSIWSSDNTHTSGDVAALLRAAAGASPSTAHAIQTTLEMWTSGRLVAAVLSREHFTQAGLSHLNSLSFNDGFALHVALNYSATTMQSLDPPSPAPSHPLAHLVAEALVFHVAHVQFGMSHTEAIHLEHQLHGSGAVSNRLEAELSLSDNAALLCRRSWMELMHQLCLGVDVDTQWHKLPPATRDAIIARIGGKPVRLTDEFSAWASDTRVDMATADFHVNLALELYSRSTERRHDYSPDALSDPAPLAALLKPVAIPRGRQRRTILQSILHSVTKVPFVVVKWIAILSGGGSNIERELVYLLENVPGRAVILGFTLLVWKICALISTFWVYWILIYHRPAVVQIERLASKGARRKTHKNRVVVELTRSAITGFASIAETGNLSLRVFNGTLVTEPDVGDPVFVATYDSKYRLTSRVDKDGRTSTFQYAEGKSSRRPVSRHVEHKGTTSFGVYDKRGRIIKGSVTVGGSKLGFQYHYNKSTQKDASVLRADFALVGSNDTLSVFWGKPVDTDDYTWVPSKNVGLIVRRIGTRIYTTTYDWSHRRDPVITTRVDDGQGKLTAVAEAPPLCDSEGLLIKLPADPSFDADDLLIYHSPLRIAQMRRFAAGKTSVLSRWINPAALFTSSKHYTAVPTWRIRTELWSKWLKSNGIDAVTACTVDELVLRQEPLLRDYWRARDRGLLDRARNALDANLSQIVAAIDIDTDVSEVTLLAIRTSDLYAMGLGKDAPPMTTRPQDCYNDTTERISVIFNDVGCWPIAPGGVSNCRRDLVNGHSTIRNHVLAECANDYGNPRFQIEKSVQSLKLLPLWGLDGGTANHGLIDNLLESQVDEKVDDTDLDRDIVGVFIPLLQQFVKGCRTKRYSYADIVHLSNVFLSMAKYYQYKDYTRTWRSVAVEEAWVAAWLEPHDDSNIVSPADCFDISRPSMFDFKQALNIYLAYFFIFAVGVPDRCPRVFQSTHHGISSLFGMVLKYRRGVTFGIWDHAILWRECCLNFSVAQCELPVAVQSMLLAGIGVATRLAYTHADVILPCASLFNPMWEVELGTDGARVYSRSQFRRKIDPIVNGISDMDGYKPVDKIRTEKPTVVMLSNVQFIKGVKAAIQSADIIVNRYGFTDYKLVVYGAKDRQPAYALEMEKLIVERNLSEHVVLAGFGNSKEVLKDAWLFMNSSISEGLPLAIGEAALAGVPIVATEVGATALVLTDPESTQRYGEVVPPNDPVGLARAQISILSMVGPWAKFTEAKAEAALPEDITPDDVKWLTERFYRHAEDRRALGLLSRKVVLHSFHGSRYIREHEQMYWIQWHLARMRADPALKALPFKFGAPEPLSYMEGE
ncbi:hypothetical protein Q8F55_003253 [Vanrija albida]|uniref:DUF3492 domain-containing protein n=1 Tax=Vanrija albida TaxID=181172 RepID=A0ABR3QC48_9TREE